uniref:Uncharacterized protein n=1 Tax=Hyaloperonospora arabidopsidis (strain Emoy2) TaxID=559515 RepID=M4BMN7_HYAAE
MLVSTCAFRPVVVSSGSRSSSSGLLAATQALIISKISLLRWTPYTKSESGRPTTCSASKPVMSTSRLFHTVTQPCTSTPIAGALASRSTCASGKLTGVWCATSRVVCASELGPDACEASALDGDCAVIVDDISVFILGLDGTGRSTLD